MSRRRGVSCPIIAIDSREWLDPVFSNPVERGNRMSLPGSSREPPLSRDPPNLAFYLLNDYRTPNLAILGLLSEESW